MRSLAKVVKTRTHLLCQVTRVRVPNRAWSTPPTQSHTSIGRSLGSQETTRIRCRHQVSEQVSARSVIAMQSINRQADTCSVSRFDKCASYLPVTSTLFVHSDDVCLVQVPIGIDADRRRATSSARRTREYFVTRLTTDGPTNNTQKCTTIFFLSSRPTCAPWGKETDQPQ